MNTEKKKTMHMPCPVCHGGVYGRSDKIYCSITCKNRHHYVARQNCKPMVFELNRRLMRNLVILEGMMGEQENVMQVQKSALVRHGFDLDLVTQVKIKGNKVLMYCYHLWYTIQDNGIVTVRRNKRIGAVMPGFYERWAVEYPKGGVEMDGVFGRKDEIKQLSSDLRNSS